MSLKDYKEYGPLTDKMSRTIINLKVSHAYIIEGDRCAGKEKLARDFVKAVLCSEKPGTGCDLCTTCRKIDHDNYEDLYYVKADDLSLKDTAIWELQKKLKGKPTGGDRNIAIIEDADTMTPRAQNRLLKTLEEPNPGTLMILLSENTENLLTTISSRCITYRLGNFIQNDYKDETGTADEIAHMVENGAYFCDIKESLAKGVKDRKSALSLLDGLERLYSRKLAEESCARSKESALKKKRIITNVKYIEEARREILANVNYKYAIRNLVLKIGG